ncbi:MAG: hypothetical protein J5841_03590 [Clostridia bacterium]|nr:hypothetical protein [Clostridia bacterium]
MRIIRTPEISAIYFGLLESGYEFYTIERSAGHVGVLQAFRGKEDASGFFSGTKQQTCEVYPYWPRAFILETAALFLNENCTGFRDKEALYRRIRGAGTITDRERGNELWEWLDGFPKALIQVLGSDSFSAYMEWEKQWTDRQNEAYRKELSLIARILDHCISRYRSPVKEIRICINPIKCVYSSDYHLEGDSFLFTSGAFRTESVIHEFLHHIVHPFTEELKPMILERRPADETIDESYYQEGSDSGILNAFEETVVRSLTEAVIHEDYPGDLTDYIRMILEKNAKR